MALHTTATLPALIILTGDYAGQQAVWSSRRIGPGTPLSRPIPLFRKLDAELGRTGPEWARI